MRIGEPRSSYYPILLLMFLLLIALAVVQPSPEARARSYYARAVVATEKHDNERAVALLGEAIRVAPDMASAFLARGRVVFG
jgi:hypothetical protein